MTMFASMVNKAESLSQRIFTSTRLFLQPLPQTVVKKYGKAGITDFDDSGDAVSGVEVSVTLTVDFSEFRAV